MSTSETETESDLGASSRGSSLGSSSSSSSSSQSSLSPPKRRSGGQAVKEVGASLLVAGRKGIDVLEEGLEDAVEAAGSRAAEAIVGATLENVKTLVKDDAMPRFVHRMVDATVDGIAPVVKAEVVRGVVVPLVRVAGSDAGDASSPDWEPWWPNFPGRLRAWVLYTLHPFDLGIWNQFRDPSFWLLMAVFNFPLYAVHPASFLLLFLISDLRDEFQLVNFITRLKTASFFGQGMIPLTIGAAQLYTCAYKSPATCGADRASTPQLDMWELAPFLVQVVLVWLAALLLPFSRKMKMYKHPRAEDIDRPGQCCGFTYYKGRGHLLHWFVLYDAIVFLVCISFSIYAYTTRGTNPMWIVKGTMYWSKVLYGVMSIPWLAFSIPGMNGVLTHAKPTGYDKTGRSRLEKRSRKKTADEVRRQYDREVGNDRNTTVAERRRSQK